MTIRGKSYGEIEKAILEMDPGQVRFESSAGFLPKPGSSFTAKC